MWSNKHKNGLLLLSEENNEKRNEESNLHCPIAVLIKDFLLFLDFRASGMRTARHTETSLQFQIKVKILFSIYRNSMSHYWIHFYYDDSASSSLFWRRTRCKQEKHVETFILMICWSKIKICWFCLKQSLRWNSNFVFYLLQIRH